MVVPPRVDEGGTGQTDPDTLVRELAKAKAADVARRAPRGVFVLAADTLIDLDGRSVGKPEDAADARRILQALSGRWHRVLTGIAVFAPDGRRFFSVAATRVEFGAVTVAQIDAYVATGEPLDKAGAYGIQSLPAGWVRTVEGDVDNVVGLPVPATLRLLQAAGYPLPPHLKVS